MHQRPTGVECLVISIYCTQYMV